jgi:hypothetical protein
MFDKARGGIREDIIGEGMHFYIPGLQNPITYEVRLRVQFIKRLKLLLVTQGQKIYKLWILH